MKRLLLLFLALNLTFIAGRYVSDVIAGGRGGGGAGNAVVVNGDTNGDGDRDVSDAVYLLSWLFSGGPDPVACAGGPDLEDRVARLESIIASCFPDRNRDGIPDCAQPELDLDRDGFLTPDDCDDADPSTFPGAVERCDLRDNDCDAEVDEGFDLATDANNCGSCGNVCAPGQRCVNGVCTSFCQSNNDCPPGMVCMAGQCVPGQQDLDRDGFAAPLDCNDNDARIFPGAAEVCDGLDNDCDAQVDEGFDFATDRNNCGGCNLVCPPGTICVNGQCVEP